MTSANIIFVGDLHVADKAPAGRVDDYMDTILNKLVAIRDICVQYGKCPAFFAGDIFHLKQGNRVSDHLRQELIHLFKSFPNMVHVIPGNHDLGPAGLASLPNQPLGTLEKAGAVVIDLQARYFDGQDGHFWLIPRPYNAVAEGAHDGEVHPEHYTLTDEERGDIEQFPAPVIGLFHASIVGPGDSRPYPHFTADSIPRFEEYDLMVSGHLHENLGVVPVGKKTLFANPGSVSRVSRNLPSYTRTVEVLAVNLTDEGKMSIEEVPLPGVKPALEVFGARLEDSPALDYSAKIDSFVEALGEDIRAEKVSWEDKLSALDGDISAPVLVEVKRLLEEAST